MLFSSTNDERRTMLIFNVIKLYCFIKIYKNFKLYILRMQIISIRQIWAVYKNSAIIKIVLLIENAWFTHSRARKKLILHITEPKGPNFTLVNVVGAKFNRISRVSGRSLIKDDRGAGRTADKSERNRVPGRGPFKVGNSPETSGRTAPRTPRCGAVPNNNVGSHKQGDKTNTRLDGGS